MPVPRGSTVVGGLLAILGGPGAVGLGLEPVQRCLFTLFPGGVATRCGSVSRLDEVGAVTGARIAVTTAPLPIDRSPAAVVGGIIDGDHPRRQVTQFRRQVPCPCRGVTMVCGHIPRHRPVHDLVDLSVPLRTALVPLGGNGVAVVGRAVPAISSVVAVVGGVIPAIGSGVALVGCTVPALGSGLALVRHPISLVCGALSLGQPVLALRHVHLRTLTR